MTILRNYLDTSSKDEKQMIDILKPDKIDNMFKVTNECLVAL
jgi:hypothetical protein